MNVVHIDPTEAVATQARTALALHHGTIPDVGESLMVDLRA